MTVPAQPAGGSAGPPPGPAGLAGTRGLIAGRLWRRTFLRAAAVPLIVLAPLIALAPTADSRFNIYMHGGLFRDNPLLMVPHTLHTIPSYLALGNFRPLGRLVEKSFDLATYTLTGLTGLPANVSFRLFEFAAAVVLTLVAVLFAESVVTRGRLFAGAPSTVAALTPFAVGTGFVAAGANSPAVLFGGLYLTSAAIVLGTAALACRGLNTERRVGWPLGLLVVLAGAALASFNEITYFALPLATVAVAARGLGVLGLGWRSLLTGRAARLLVLLWAGFLPVFATIRVIIYLYCSTRTCYRGSDITLNAESVVTMGVRTVAWLPPVMWSAAVHGTGRPWLTGVVPLLALVLLAVLAVRTVRDLPRLTPVGPRAAAGLAAAAFALLILGGALGGLNSDVQLNVQRGLWGMGWRDTALTACAGSLLLLAAVHAALRGPRTRKWGLLVVTVLLVLAATASTAANKRYRDHVGPTTASLIANQVAQEMAEFDRTAAGNLRRCGLRQRFQDLYPNLAFSQKRFTESLDLAAEQLAGVPFCEESP